MEAQLERLSFLSKERPRPRVFERDDTTLLDPKTELAWAQLMASIATSEAIEGVLLSSLLKGFQGNTAIANWIELHSQDEIRHLNIISNYLKKTFQYEKKKRSLTDLIIYDSILPLVAKTAESRPIYVLAIIYFYETFSVAFYKEFKTRAMKAGLKNLVEIFKVIEKDELRHAAGIKTLIGYTHKEMGLPSFKTQILVASLLLTVIADINTSVLAVFNRRLRKNIKCIGLNPEEMNAKAYKIARDTFSLVRGNCSLPS